MREDVELEDSLKREILELEAKLGTVDYFALLGLPPEAEPAEVKRVFVKLCRRLHPDRHFRRKLGSFKARLDTVFQALSKAHQTLVDVERREAYLKATPSARKPPPPPPPKVRAKRMTWNVNDLSLLSKKEK